MLDVGDFYESIYPLAFIAVNSLTLFIMSSSLLVYGRHIKNNLIDSTALLGKEANSSTTPTTVTKGKNVTEEHVTLKIKFKILARINKILIIVLVCYALRVISLGYLFVLVLTGNEGFTYLALWLLFSWLVPSLPVSITIISTLISTYHCSISKFTSHVFYMLRHWYI